jgi:dCMP deaminase
MKEKYSYRQERIKEKYIHAYMKMATIFADCSEANRLKVGCIAVKDDKIISLGINGTPSGWPSNACEDEHGHTLPEVLHAESNMLMKLARSDGNAEHAIVFVTHSPCLACAKLLFQAGVSRVYYENEYRSLDGVSFLRQAGIEVVHLKKSDEM